MKALYHMRVVRILYRHAIAITRRTTFLLMRVKYIAVTQPCQAKVFTSDVASSARS